MATTISNGESGSSVRTKLNNIWEGLQVNEIASTISDTAVDVFVYDTRKDSDGGAWRKRTQHTSWYNETLNTATRGSRKEFPSVAVIVAESGTVTIYDGDDPDLPMWMVFNNTSSHFTNTISAVSSLNGLITVTGTTLGCRVFSFIDDIMGRYSTASFGVWNGGLADRNDTLTFTTTGASTSQIVNTTSNDVAMTVLPNAPIDAATGLPVPTIAVATDGGVSVIKDDGTVVDIVYSSSTVDAVSLTDNSITFLTSFGNNFVGSIPSSDISSGSASTLASLLGGYYLSIYTTPALLGAASKVAA